MSLYVTKDKFADAAILVLQKRGITHSGSIRKRRLGPDQVGDASPTKQKKAEMHLPVDTTGLYSASEREISTPQKQIPGLHHSIFEPQLTSVTMKLILSNHAVGFLYAVIKAINMRKGGPRVSLFELCKQLQWQMPTFIPTEKDSRLTTFINLCCFS